jgi:cation transport ATPase
MATQETIEVPIQGMDCAECTMHVQQAIASIPGVEVVKVLLSSEKAIVQHDPHQVNLRHIRQAITDAGYKVTSPDVDPTGQASLGDFNRRVLSLFGVVFAAVLFIVVIGEMFGLFEAVAEIVPWPLGIAIVLLFGYPIFRGVIQSTLKGQITAHTLMSIGAVAALVVGEWATAAVVVFFMRVGEYAERFTTERSRQALKDLTVMSPKKARVERDGEEREVSVEDIRVGETVIVRLT